MPMSEEIVEDNDNGFVPISLGSSSSTSKQQQPQDNRRRRELGHRRRRRQGRRRRKKTMEGLRLRTDSDGSTKNAFYQGTIVSDAVQKVASGRKNLLPPRPRDPNRRSKTKTTIPASPAGDASIKNGNLSHFGSAFGPSVSRPVTNGGSQISPYTIGSIANDLDAAHSGIRHYEGGGSHPNDSMLFDLSDIGNGIESLRSRDSLRYSTQSQLSGVSQFLVGTNIMSEDQSASRATDEEVSSDIFSGLDALQSQISPAASTSVSEKGLLASVDANDSLVAEKDGPDLLADCERRSSVLSIGSGIYFNQPAPPGPILPGQSPVFNNQYPTQQARTSNGYGSLTNPRKVRPATLGRQSPAPTIEEDDEDNDDDSIFDVPWSDKLLEYLDLTAWLSRDVLLDDDGVPYYSDASMWTLPGIIRKIFYNPLHPEFTSLQQFCWAVVIGAFMGVFTAVWKLVTEACVNLTWRIVPTKLLEWGIFSDLNGAFPLYHYMWIVPALFGGLLSFVSVILPTPIPTQNEWIHTLHYRGVQESESLVPTFVLATMAMSSGLSLGPELPLVLTAGMIGSWVGLLCHQSMLSARVMNLTAASAAIGGFFGFPMAGAMFVLELPHEMGLQYFEAVSPATISSIVAVLINRIVINNDVTGMFQYPFLNESLPSYIFKDAIIYGLLGGALGVIYVFGVKSIKSGLHHMIENCDTSKTKAEPTEEATPLMRKPHPTNKKASDHKTPNLISCFLGQLAPNKCVRAAVTGTLAGAAVGITGIFLPHIMFWGEAQLQTMIDKGKTPLPVFGHGDEPTAALVSLGYCMVDRSEEAGSSLGCSLAMVVAKIFVTGLSLGTGVVGGQFWAPLMVGCAASHFFTDSIQHLGDWLGYSFSLSAYPCVALLCMMGATHVVTFRAHVAIILILTLSIDAFVPKDGTFSEPGDYAAVFPLLTVAVFVSLHLSRNVIFYERKRCRGDIMVVPQALCQPGKEGRPLVLDYEGKLRELDESDYEYETDSDLETSSFDDDEPDIPQSLSQNDIESNFQSTQLRGKPPTSPTMKPSKSIMKQNSAGDRSRRSMSPPLQGPRSLVPPPPPPPPLTAGNSSLFAWDEDEGWMNKDNNRSMRTKDLRSLDELLNGPIKSPSSISSRKSPAAGARNRKHKAHRRSHSEPVMMESGEQRTGTMGDAIALGQTNRARLASSSGESIGGSSVGSTLGRPSFKRVDSYGEIYQEQPSLMDQARQRAASAARAEWNMM